MDNNRKIALDVLLDIEKNKAYSNLSLNNFIGQTESGEEINPAFIREIVYGVLRYRNLLDYYIERVLEGGFKRIKLKELCLLRMGFYQLKFMDSVPEYAAVSETVALAKKVSRGKEGFINWALRGYLREKSKILEPNSWNIKYSIDEWIIDLWKKSYGAEETLKILEGTNSRVDLTIRVNLTKTSKENLKKALEKKNFSVKECESSDRSLVVTGRDLLKTAEYKRGEFSVQDSASIWAIDVLDPEKEELILDLCAAPGGKTFSIAEKQKNTGEIIAIDKYSHKLKLMKNEAKRLGLDKIILKEGDSTIFIPEFVDKFDRVLADVPCSGLGVMRHKPEIKYKEEIDLAELENRQREILENGAKYVKPGGILFYSTCTINPDENEKQIAKFINGNENFRIIEMKQRMPYMDTDGFFICKMVREEK